MFITLMTILGVIGYFGLKALSLIVGIVATLIFLAITIGFTVYAIKCNAEASKVTETVNKVYESK